MNGMNESIIACLGLCCVSYVQACPPLGGGKETGARRDKKFVLVSLLQICTWITMEIA